MTELRQRYLQDLRLRNYALKTQQAYVECVSLFARYFKRSPEVLEPEHIRLYQLYLVDEKKCSWSRFNQTVCALRFLYRNTLGRDWAITHIPFPRKQKKLPILEPR
jgi:integrase/recombinase XerD